MNKIFLIALIFTKIISLKVSAQESGPLIPEIRNLILKTGANQQAQMTESHLDLPGIRLQHWSTTLWNESLH